MRRAVPFCAHPTCRSSDHRKVSFGGFRPSAIVGKHLRQIDGMSGLAELTNLGRSKVNSSLKALEGRGHIRRRYGSIEVTNAPGLRDFVAELTPHNRK